MAFNGPNRELHGPDLQEETVYCVACGTVFVWASGRSCPSCHLAEKLEESHGQE